MVPFKGFAKEVSFEWSQLRFHRQTQKLELSTLHVSIIDSGSESLMEPKTQLQC